MSEVHIPVNELNEFDLPRVCVVTGRTDNVVFKPVKFSWYPPWIGGLVVISWPIALILMLAMTKRAAGSLPFTEEAHAAWQKGKLLFGLSFVSAIITLVMGVVLLANDVVPGAILIPVAIAEPIFVGVKYFRKRGPGVRKIKDNVVSLKLPSAEATMQINAHLHAGKGAGIPNGMPQPLAKIA